MEVGMIEVGIAVSSGLVSAGLVWKFTSDKISALETLMHKKVEHDACELHRKAQVEKCGMIHSGMDRMMAGIDKKFEQISEQIESLRTERRDEIQNMTAMLREFLNEQPRRK